MHPTWTEQLPTDLQTDENYAVFDKYEKLGDFATDFIKVNGDITALTGERDELKGSVTKLDDQIKGMIAIPTADSPDEVKAAFHKMRGVPESVDGYGLEDLAKDDSGKTILEAFRGANLDPEQASAMVNFLTSHFENTEKAQKEASAEAVKKFKEGLGADKARVTFKNAEDAITHFFKEEDREGAKASIMSDPKMISVYSNIGTLLKERPAIFASIGANEGSGDLYPSMSKMGIR